MMLSIVTHARMQLATTKQPEPEVTLSLEPLHDSRPVHGTRFSSNNLLASVGFDGSLHLWQLSPGWDDPVELYASVQCSKRPLLQVDFSPSGEQALCAGADGRIYCVDTNTGEKVVVSGHESYVNGVVSMGGDDLFASSSDDCTMRVWDLKQKQTSAAEVVEMDRECTSVAWSQHQPHLLFAGSLDNSIRCFDRRRQGGALYTLLGHRDTVTGLGLHPATGRELVSAGLDGTLRIWDVSPFSGAETRQTHLIKHGSSNPGGDMIRCTYSPCGKYVSAGSGASSECTVCVWDAAGRPFKAFPGHSLPVLEVAFHPSENKMATCGMDARLLLGTF